MASTGLFLDYLRTDPVFFVAVIVTIIVSITLHELAHGLTAVALGDDTPIRQHRLTLNPMVHMGLWSFLAMLIMGIAWGAMPINPSRLRGRFGEALVAAAGPATNALLALLGLTALGVWYHFGAAGSTTDKNWQRFLWIFGYINVALAIFNLIPIPPLDGSAILDNFVPGYRTRITSKVKPITLLIVVFIVLDLLDQAHHGLFTAAAGASNWWLGLVMHA